MSVNSKVLADGRRNATVRVTGVLESDISSKPIEIFDVSKLEGGHQRVKLMSALWLVQEKLGLRLWWGPGKFALDNMLFVCESRNSVRFDNGVPAPGETWDGKIWMDTFGFDSNSVSPKLFTLILDFDK